MIAWFATVAIAQDRSDELPPIDDLPEEALPEDDGELPPIDDLPEEGEPLGDPPPTDSDESARATEREAPSPPPAPTSLFSVSLLGGVSGWYRPGTTFTVLGTYSMRESLMITGHLAATHMMVTSARGPGRVGVLLPEAAIGVALSPPAPGQWNPVVGAELTATVWKVDPRSGLPGLAPGLQARAGLVRPLRDTLFLTVDALLGGRVAPGLTADVNRTWSNVAGYASLRAGVGMTW